MRRILLVLAVVSTVACSKSESGSPPGSACTSDSECQSGSCVSGVCQAAGADAGGTPDGAIACLDQGSICATDQSPGCCSGLLCIAPDGAAGLCQGVPLCKANGEACASGTECCSLNCQGGSCSGTQCKQIGADCSVASDCCSGTCDSGKCAAVPGALCRTLGEACATGAECCSKNCQGGACQRVSHCSAGGDICFKSLDCCNGVCNVPAGGGAGVCAVSVTVPGATNCIMGGEPCTDGGNCCSRMCTDLGTGGKACVLGSGCHERGEICSKNEDCCGHATSGVICMLAQQDPPVGRCSNPQACQPVGNCCGAVADANCRQACCDGQKEVCREDISGLARCFGGGGKCANGYDGLDPDCCIPDGQECQFRDQCCNLAPCIQVNGKYVCAQPQCVAAGQACTPGATGAGSCCNGLSCLSSGELGQAVCRTVTPSEGADAGTGPGPGEDAGVPACTANGGACSSAGQCCSGSCIGGVCGICHADGQTCTGSSDCCSGICSAGKCVAPQTCVAMGGTCSGTSECCTGLSCTIPAGQANGTCQTGAGCGASGQACSATQPCCANLRCANTATAANCAPGDAQCACRVVLN